MMIRQTLRTLALAIALFFVVPPAPAFSQDDAEYSADELDADGFRAVEGSPTDDVPGGTLLIGAYLALWVLVGGYLVRLSRRHAAVQEEYASLRRALEDIDDRLNEMGRGE